MGVTTDFVVASEEELHRAFETQVPLEMRLVEKNFDAPRMNPFTGEPLEEEPLGLHMVREYIPIGKPYAETHPKPVVPFWKRMLGLSPRPVDSFHHLPHAYLKNMDHVTVAQLHHAIDGTDFHDAIEMTIDVMEPANEPRESFVQKFCSQFVTALATIDDSQLPDVTARWMLAEEVQFDQKVTQEVLVEIRALARIAVEQNKGLYLASSC